MKNVFIIANWKMQLDDAASEALAQEVVRRWAGQGATRSDVTVVLCPSHVALERVHPVVKGTAVWLGAQDCFWEDKGAYTGEVSPVTLKQLGCEWCIVGHSERRGFLNETDEMVNRKVAALMRSGINPIVCVGETREERTAGRRDAVVIGQVRAALANIRPVGTQRIVIAYEPRWVIGTGQAVAPEDAASMHNLIIQTLFDLYPNDIVERQFSVIYGGSVDSTNLAGFLSFDVIHGALVGGAALKADEFVRLAEIAADSIKP
ncbi:MAG: triose-phosphate isomerase [Patescibacteria group bacterium]|nr:triose-phosphate isomerase [Patescibacteria group bacterium]